VPRNFLALGVSGRADALALLNKMLNDPSVQKWRSNITDAIDVNVRMRNFGPSKVFNPPETENQR